MRDWLGEAARTRPDHVAVEAPDGPLTYAELDRRAQRRSTAARGAGRRRGGEAWRRRCRRRRLRRAAPRAPRLGAALVPLNTRLTADQQRPRPRPSAPTSSSTRRSTGWRRRSSPGDDIDPDAVHTVLFTSGTDGRAEAGRADRPATTTRPPRLGRCLRQPSPPTAGSARCRCSTSPA